MDKSSRPIWGDLQLALILVITALPVLVLSIYLYKHSIDGERRLARLDTEIIAKSLARRVQNFTRTRLVAMRLFAAYYEGSDVVDDGEFAGFCQRLHQDYPEFCTFIYADAHGDLEQIYPKQDRVAATRQLKDAGLMEVIRGVLASRSGRVISRTSLVCHGEGITIFHPIIKNGKPAGVILGSIPIPNGVEQIFGEEVLRYWSFRIRDSHGQLIYNSDNGLDSLRHGNQEEVSEQFPFGEDSWMLSIRSKAALQDVLRTESPERILICGALTTVLIICGVSVLYWRQKALRLALIETRRAHDIVKASEKHFHDVMERVHLLGMVLDPDARIVFCNDRFLQTSGYTREEVIGKDAIELLAPPQERSLYRKLRQDVRTGKVRELHSRMTLMTRDGKMRQIFWNHVISWGTDGQIELLTSLGDDITDRVAQEEAQRQAQKLESLGVLAGGIAHDFNNLLTTIIGHNDLAVRKAGPDSKLLPHLDNIGRTARRLADLTSQMLAYSGRGRFEVREVDLNTLVEEMGDLLHISIPKRVEIRYDLAPDLPRIEVDVTQVEQVVLNLVTNASEAIHNRPGQITLKTSFHQFDVGETPDSQLAPGTYLQLSVKDNGCGMDSNTLLRIFDPFFTTKFTGRGLGLAVLQGIVRGHGGVVTVDSQPGLGTTFHVYFPVKVRANPSPEVERSIGREVTSNMPDRTLDKYDMGGTVLIIDDEEGIRLLASDILQSAGFKTLSAADGESGVELFQRHRRDIAVILLDLTMPGMGGEATYAQLCSIDPAVRVVMTSGFSNMELEWQFQGKNLAGFVHKPFLPEELSSKIIRVALNTSSPQNN